MIVLQGLRDRLERVLFSPDASAAFAQTWQGVQMWRPFASAGAPVVLPAPYSSRFEVTPDGQRLLASNGSFRVVHIDTRHVSEVKLWDGYGAYFALSRGGDVFVAGQNRGGGHRMSARRLSDGGTLWERPVEPWWVQPLFLPGDEEFVRVAWESGVGRRGWEFRIVTHETATGEELRRSEPLAAEVRDWVVSPDGRLAACRVTVWVHVYPLRETFTKPLATLRNDNRKEFTGVAFHPSGKYLAVTSNDATVKLYDTTDWQVAKTYTWAIGRMRSVAFSPDGTLAAAGSDTGKVVVWDVDA